MLDAGREPLEPAPWAGFRDSGPRENVEATRAADLDRALVRLARLEARSRLRLGRVGAAFLALRGHEDLGFVRVGDYARERLGISGRELQSFAFVASRLAALPCLAAAFLRGEVCWSRVRLLCSVADVESEEAWIARSRGLTVAELARLVRDEARGASPAESGEAVDEVLDETEGEPRVRFAVSCPARVALLWRRAIELARRMLGSEALVWQAAEAIAAEAFSAMPDVGRIEMAEPRTEQVVTLERRPETSSGRPASEVRLHQVPTELSLEEDVSDDASVDVSDPVELDAEMRFLVRELQQVDARLGRGLRRICDLRLHRALGFDSFDLYVRERLGVSASKARSLVAIERGARSAPALGAAFSSGELSWARAVAILPVARGASERAWISRAGEVMVRRLHAEVSWALDRRDAWGVTEAPPDHGAKLEPPDLQTCARFDGQLADRRVTFFGPSSVVSLFRATVTGLCEPTEPHWKGLERLLLHAITEWEAQPRHRDPVFARDGWRCSVPGCSARRGLQDHHITWRSRGGGNEQENRAAACAAHHLHAIHRGTIRASGRAPDDIRWELGVSPGRAPLLVLDGERYLRPSGL